MLSGARDEIVPKEHMRALWEVVARRGEKRTPGGLEYKVGLERAKFMEFADGGHSESFIGHDMTLAIEFFLDDTCVQTGYWPAVAEFVNSLSLEEPDQSKQ